ncbi:DUF7528 family protein [Haladaptatus sp. CMSO5]|uniref:DUF7528 family protein n=1 Tax=Haladaptatus sp. CMSO5 TaxID=3120514 RepID=UPI002FCE5599
MFVTIDGETHELPPAVAQQLHDDLGDALCQRTEFFKTVSEYRENGSYRVSRRAGSSSGNAEVFRRFEELERLYDRLPETFTATDVGKSGITGLCRHLLVRHVAEHPAFDCRITRRNPLAVKKA